MEATAAESNVLEKNSESLWRRKPGWVFNPYFDFLTFIGAIYFAFILNPTNALAFLFVKIGVDQGHVFATFAALIWGESSLEEKLILRRIARNALVLMSLVLLLFFIRPSWFPVFLGYMAFSHLVMQLFGWIARMQRESGISQVQKWIEIVFFWFLVLCPFAYFHHETSKFDRSYFYRDNLIFLASTGLVSTLHLLLQGAFIAFLGNAIVSYRQNIHRHIGRLLLFAWIGFVFYGGIIVFQSPIIFWTSLILNHGATYYIYLLVRSFRSSRQIRYPVIRWKRSYFVSVPAFLIGSAAIWYVLIQQGRPVLGLDPIFFSPLLMHYFFDMQIWKRKTYSSLLVK